LQDLIDNLDRDLTYAVEVEGKMQLADVSNYHQVLSVVGPHCPAAGPAQGKRVTAAHESDHAARGWKSDACWLLGLFISRRSTQCSGFETNT
jgi:hypothetical protein